MRFGPFDSAGWDPDGPWISWRHESMRGWTSEIEMALKVSWNQFRRGYRPLGPVFRVYFQAPKGWDFDLTLGLDRPLFRFGGYCPEGFPGMVLRLPLMRLEYSRGEYCNEDRPCPVHGKGFEPGEVQ